jgi:hypothetical protein
MRGSVISALYLQYSALINQETYVENKERNKKRYRNFNNKISRKRTTWKTEEQTDPIWGDSRKEILRETGSIVLMMILLRNQMKNMLGGETGKIAFGRIYYTFRTSNKRIPL